MLLFFILDYNIKNYTILYNIVLDCTARYGTVLNFMISYYNIKILSTCKISHSSITLLTTCSSCGWACFYPARHLFIFHQRNIAPNIINWFHSIWLEIFTLLYFIFYFPDQFFISISYVTFSSIFLYHHASFLLFFYSFFLFASDLDEESDAKKEESFAASPTKLVPTPTKSEGKLENIWFCFSCFFILIYLICLSCSRVSYLLKFYGRILPPYFNLSISLSLSISISTSLFLSLLLSISIHLSIFPYFSLSFSLFITLCLSLSLSLYLFFSPYLSHSLYYSLSLSFPLFTSLSLSLSLLPINFWSSKILFSRCSYWSRQPLIRLILPSSRLIIKKLKRRIWKKNLIFSALNNIWI